MDLRELLADLQAAAPAHDEALLAEDEEDSDEREFVGDYEDEGVYEDEVDEELDDEGGESVEDGEIEEVDDGDDGEATAARGFGQQAAYIAGLAPLPANGAGARTAPAVPDWTGLGSLPAPTQRAFVDLLSQLKAQGRTSLTMLLLGKAGVGKSSTANSLFAEKAAPVAAFQSPSDGKPAVLARVAAGFTLRVIDTPALLDGDSVSSAAVEAVVAAVVEAGGVDVALYLDRLDLYRVETADREVLAAVTDALGPSIWRHALLGLTRAAAAPGGKGQGYDDYVDARSAALRKAIAAAGAPADAPLPLVLIENASTCAVDEAGQKVLPDGRPWLPLMMSEVADAAARAGRPYVYDAGQRVRANPNNRRKWLVPLLLAGQLLFKVLVLDRLLEEDRITGDQYGPYDKEYIAEERQRLREEKREAAKCKAAAKEDEGGASSSSDEDSDADD